MGAASQGFKEGQKAGQKQGQKAGANSDPEENIFKEGAKSAGKGAAAGAAEGAARGAVKGGISGVKDGVKKGAELGAKIPYAGPVTGVLGGIVGGAVGGVGGAALGGTTGALGGAASGATEGAEATAENRYGNGSRNIKHNIRGAFQGNAKDIFILKIKLVLYGIIIALVFFALIVEAVAESVSAAAAEIMSAFYSSSSSESGEMYNNTGSLILATDKELQQLVDDYMQDLEKTNTAYFNALSTKYSKKDSNTVANKVQHITSNYEANETKEVDIIGEKPIGMVGEASAKDERTIYEHILRTEKYNFNNIIWRSFVKSGTGLTTSNMYFTLDPESKLKYPLGDANASNNADLNLEFFITKTRPYLQSWYIPLDITVGTQDAQNTSNLNTDLAYEIITSAYHEIVLDRYKIENLTRKTDYLVYDKTTTTNTTTRTCNDYTITNSSATVIKKAGEACTRNEYLQGLCKDSVMKKNCKDISVKDVGNAQLYAAMCLQGGANATFSCIDVNDKVWPSFCSYGVLKADKKGSTSQTTTKTYCTDKVEETINTETDIRESKVAGKDETDKLTYSWNYVISMAKMFDKVISNTYDFKSYYQYPLNNYNNFINKRGQYTNMTVEEFRESEKSNSQADSFAVEEADYNETTKETPINNSSWNSKYVVTKIPAGAKIQAGTKQSKVIEQTVEVTKTGKEYTDEYSWSDTLKFGESKSGIYNVESVKDVTGDDLTASDVTYYNDLYKDKDLNLIDLMNSDDSIYKRYIETESLSNSTSNIGIRKSKLDISYNVLKKDLTELAEKYPLSGLMYGNSLDILEGLNLGAVVAAGSVNDAMINLALVYEGYNLSEMMSQDQIGVFYRNHWCAMFVSYCMRRIEQETGVEIPIPNYFACTQTRKDWINRVGFYDVIEHTGNTGINSQSVKSIQPGDIIFFDWSSDGDRDHTAIVKEVVTDQSGNVTDIITIDGNLGGGSSSDSYNYSKVKIAHHKSSDTGPYGLKAVASFISLSTVMYEYETTGAWGEKTNGN